MIERISDWANDETICVDGRAYTRANSDPASYYRGYSDHTCIAALHPEWLFFRIRERWPDLAIEMARDMLLELDKSLLSETCQSAYDDAVNLDILNGSLERHVETIRLEARENRKFERAVFYFIRWRTGKKYRPAGPFIMMIMDYKRRTGHQGVEAEMVRWLHERVPIEKWVEGLEA